MLWLFIGGVKPQNNRPNQGIKNSPRVVKSATNQKVRLGAKSPVAKKVVAQVRPKNTRTVPAPKKQKLVLLDPPRNVKPAMKANAMKKPTPQAVQTRQLRPNSAGSRPTSAARNPPAVATRPAYATRPAVSARPAQFNKNNSVSDLTLALQTANSIAINRSHPRQTDVVELLRTHEKGWIDDHKFVQVLRGMIF